MSNLVLIIMVICGGIAIAVQPSINARLAQKIGSMESSMISFAVGTLVLFILVMLTGRGSNLKGLGNASWWELTGGFMGAFFVTMAILAVPRLGTAAVMTIVIAGQLTTGLLLDHFGVFGLRQIPISPIRGFGIALLCLGATLVVRR